MAGYTWRLLLLIVGLTLAAGDYARYAEFVKQQAHNATFVRLFDEHLPQFQDNNQKSSQTFKCKAEPVPPGETTSVHKLRATDIKIVAALGDSITAGTGIKAATVIGLLKEDRGLSWSIGGDKTVDDEETIPNILKVYNPGVVGYSKGSGPVWLESSSRLNVANPGDKSAEMPDQAVMLVNRMKKEKDVNFAEDWKVITLFIGGNDLCKYCDDKELYKAENYVANIQKALDHLHANVPRAFVNLVEVLDISIVKRLNQNFVCDTLHFFLCGCAAFPADSAEEQELQAETLRYRKLTRQLIESGRYDTHNNFTVVVQPFFSKTAVPNKENSDEPDLSYFAPDCFHLSLKGHRAASDALWNNMVEPVGKKREAWTPGEEVECPSESAPYFFTSKNSVQSTGLGAVHDNQPLYQEPDTQPQNQSGQHSASIATITIAAVAMVCVTLAVIGAVAWRKNKRVQGETEMLLKSAHVQAYTEI